VRGVYSNALHLFNPTKTTITFFEFIINFINLRYNVQNMGALLMQNSAICEGDFTPKAALAAWDQAL
jgi:hypothetical protein